MSDAPPDPRLTPANGRVAAERLRGLVQADRYVAGEPRRVSIPVADLDGIARAGCATASSSGARG